MDGSSAERDEVTTRDEWVALLCRHFDSWGLTDGLLARAAAERVMRAIDARSGTQAIVEPVELANRWIRSMADSGGSSDWFFRAPSLLSRFPAAFLETDVPDVLQHARFELLPELSPLHMPEQEVIGPITHVVRVATEAMEGVAGPVLAQRQSADNGNPFGS